MKNSKAMRKVAGSKVQFLKQAPNSNRLRWLIYFAHTRRTTFSLIVVLQGR